ncbi:cytochrome c oxidase assembly factor Coa1 family protein [Rhodocytophaga aerolata]|uniref:Cytochrome c oxidase assembly factor Coa1 family protein n=1 Tax=Rhodocytophaga aerolata TaxID=455078 RepID=A0ABT8RKK2_9BACT|nr:cytochrome c oxidase assembly factor Coa1 family protein [Rhodocytophaga aerolata]MDO1451422.1 cytochrome c oxidase assembly factor Coa1 family protein [Rhodocytophaga aerolata]
MIKPEKQVTVELIKRGAITFVIIGLLIVFFIFHKLNNSDVSKVAKEYILTSEEIKARIGEVKEFGWASIGSIEESQQEGQAQLNFAITGANKKADIQIYLSKDASGWKVDKYKLE